MLQSEQRRSWHFGVRRLKLKIRAGTKAVRIEDLPLHEIRNCIQIACSVRYDTFLKFRPKSVMGLTSFGVWFLPFSAIHSADCAVERCLSVHPSVTYY